MIGMGIAFLVLGLVLLLAIQWTGVAAGIVGLVLAILGIAGFERRAAALGGHTERPRI